MKTITPLGKKWEWMHSLWLFWLLIPFGFTAFISFFYISIRAKRWKWAIFGFVYLFVLIVALTLIEMFDSEHIVFDLSIGAILFGWIVACVHGFLLRAEYLLVMAHRKYPEIIPPISSGKISTRTIGINAKKLKLHKKLGATKEPKLININKASEKEIRQLPSVGPFLTKEIMDRRKKIKFKSYEHLISTLNMQPHILKDAKVYITFSDKELKKRKEQEMVRHRRGRIVDY